MMQLVQCIIRNMNQPLYRDGDDWQMHCAWLQPRLIENQASSIHAFCVEYSRGWQYLSVLLYQIWKNICRCVKNTAVGVVYGIARESADDETVEKISAIFL